MVIHVKWTAALFNGQNDIKELLLGIRECNRKGYGKIKCMQLDWLIKALKDTVTEYMGDTLDEEKLDN